MTQPVPLDYARPRIGPRRRLMVLLAVGACLLLLVASWRVTRWVRVRAVARQTRLAMARQNVAVLQVALDSYADNVGRYPTTAEGLAVLVHLPPGVPTWRGLYLSRVGTDPWGNAYLYTEAGGKYQLSSAGPDGKPGTADDIGAAGPLPK